MEHVRSGSGALEDSPQLDGNNQRPLHRAHPTGRAHPGRPPARPAPAPLLPAPRTGLGGTPEGGRNFSRRILPPVVIDGIGDRAVQNRPSLYSGRRFEHHKSAKTKGACARFAAARVGGAGEGARGSGWPRELTGRGGAPTSCTRPAPPRAGIQMPWSASDRVRHKLGTLHCWCRSPPQSSCLRHPRNRHGSCRRSCCHCFRRK